MYCNIESLRALLLQYSLPFSKYPFWMNLEDTNALHGGIDGKDLKHEDENLVVGSLDAIDVILDVLFTNQQHEQQ